VAFETIVRTIEHRGANTLLVSDNRGEAEITLGPTSDFEIVGIVVGLLRAASREPATASTRPRGRLSPGMTPY
jgi:hypothetical protein